MPASSIFTAVHAQPDRSRYLSPESRQRSIRYDWRQEARRTKATSEVTTFRSHHFNSDQSIHKDHSLSRSASHYFIPDCLSCTSTVQSLLPFNMLSYLWTSICVCYSYNPSTSPRQSQLHQWPQPADDDQGYQQLRSMPQLPWSEFQPVDDKSMEEQSNNAIIVKSVTYGPSLSLVGAKAEIHVKKPYADLQWGHARVERLVLEEGGKEALETFRTKGLTKEDLRALYRSILKIEAGERNDWTVDDLWRHIMRRKEKGGLSDLFDEKDLDWIK